MLGRARLAPGIDYSAQRRRCPLDPDHTATLRGLAGVGDLVAVQAARSHAYYRAGAALAGARGRRDESPLHIARAILGLAERVEVEMPLTAALVSMYDGMDPLEAVGALMSRRARIEQR